jgi:uncharacterized protein YjiS (DUF1127 family)
MLFLNPRRSHRIASTGRIRNWIRRRRDQRILDGLSVEQLKDIGFRRLPTGELGPREW